MGGNPGPDQPHAEAGTVFSGRSGCGEVVHHPCDITIMLGIPIQHVGQHVVHSLGVQVLTTSTLEVLQGSLIHPRDVHSIYVRWLTSEEHGRDRDV